MSRRILFPAALLLLSVLSACRPAAESDGEDHLAAPTPTPTLEPTAAAFLGINQDEVAEGDLPAFGTLTFEPEVVEPGAEVRVTVDSQWNGTLQYAIPGAESLMEVPFQNGEARLEVPEGAAAGMASAFIVGDDGSFAAGSFRIVDGPGLWLTIDRTVAAPGERIRMRVHAYGLPEGLYAFLEYVPLEEETEEEEEGGLPTDVVSPGGESELRLVPDPWGEMVPGSFFGAPLEEFLGKDLYLPAQMAGEFRLQAADTSALQEALAEAETLEELDALEEPNPEDVISSNTVSLSLCDGLSVLEGDLGGPGWVHVLPFGPQARPLSLHTEDGRFRFDVAPGAVFVTVSPDDGSGSRSQFVEVPCGETTTLAEAATAHLLARPASGAARTVSSRPAQPGPTIRSVLQAGGGQTRCAGAVVFQLNYSLDTAGEVGEFSDRIEQALTSKLQQTLTRVTVANSIMIRKALEEAARAQMRGEGCESGCPVSGYLDADYIVSAGIAHYEDMSYYLMHLAVVDVRRVRRAVSAEVRASSLAELTNPGTYTAFAEEFKEAGLCADMEVTPSAMWAGLPFLTLPPEGEREVEIRVTNLAGEAVPAKLELERSPACGELDPGLPTEIDASGTLTLTYKARKADDPCTETLSFRAKRIYTYATYLNANPPEDEEALVVAVGPLADVGVGAFPGGSMTQLRAEPPTPLAAVTLADEAEVEVLAGYMGPLDLKGDLCKIMAPLWIPTRDQVYQISSSQPGHEASASMKVEVDSVTGATRLILDAEAQASPPNPGERQPIQFAQAVTGEPINFIFGFASLPVLYVIDVRVGPEMEGMPALIRILWEVEGTQNEFAGWGLAAWHSKRLQCPPDPVHYEGPPNPAILRFPEGAMFYSTLINTENKPARADWYIPVPHLTEHLQIAVMVGGSAYAVSEVFRDNDGNLHPYSGQARMHAVMEVQVLPRPSEANSGGGE